jgi:hypothetical protein
MSDDIVTRLHENCGCYGAEEFGYNCTNCDAADEIERLRTLLDNTLERNKKEKHRQLEIVRKVEADRDRWERIAHLLYQQANPKGAPLCNCCVCEEYKYLAEGNMKMDYSNEVKTKYQYLYDREEYWVVMADTDGCLHKVGASFISKDEAKQYVEWRNDQDNNKKVGG